MEVVDKVPLMVCWADKTMDLDPADDGPTTEKLLNVFVPVIVYCCVFAVTNDTLANVKPAPTNILPLLQENVDVPAFSVMPVFVKFGVLKLTPPTPEEIVDDPRLSVRVDDPVDIN